MSTGQVLRIPFESKGFAGVVTVDTVTSTNISQTGLNALLNDVPHERLIGYPIMTATVEHAGSGYNAVFAWVQFVEMTPADESPSTAFLDNMPSLNQQGPFSSLGFLPTLFDAPANPNAPDLQWRAHSYLVPVLCLRTASDHADCSVPMGVRPMRGKAQRRTCDPSSLARHAALDELAA